ncbi:MAG: hypothetical protein HW380_355 [Magnetococcales bacterium]|nr:hypothetical protein [Magnetococcales bacterium]HIJ83036.1 hypothetical protein [Magnetococcales bacterium]
MQLENHSRIGIVGGGPAGSMTACFILDLAKRTDLIVEVDLFEPRDFTLTGPPGCNMCGGVISESLVQKLAVSGIHLPAEIILDTIDAYTLHTDHGNAQIGAACEEMRIACIFRGQGPKGAETQKPLPWSSFDHYLLELARQQGAQWIKKRVKKLDWDQGRPRVSWSEGEVRTYDLLVGAVGLNGPGLSMFEQMNFGYRPPRHTKSYIAELYFGSKEVEKRLGKSMHVFLLNIPGLKFLALTPKGPYATLVVLGDDIDETMLERIYQSPQVAQCFPPGWKVPVVTCHCQPRIHIGPPRHPFADRVVMVGDCSSSRLFKDGIGAAYTLAKACAYTTVVHGISKEAFQHYYAPACRKMDFDNFLGGVMFSMDRRIRPVAIVQEALLDCIRREQNDPTSPRKLSMALWDTFSGSASYRTIFANAANPGVMARFFSAILRQLLARMKN